MHAQLAIAVALELGGVVADIVDEAKPAALAEVAREHATHAVGNQLAVREREVRGGTHRSKVALALRRRQRRARELAIGQRDPESLLHGIEQAQVVGAHLVAEPS